MFGMDAPDDLERRRQLRFTDVERLGDDLRVIARF
jgi:hypothetical protein